MLRLNELCDVCWDMQVSPHEFVRVNKILIIDKNSSRLGGYLFFNEKNTFYVDKYLLELDLREKFLLDGFSKKAVKEIQNDYYSEVGLQYYKKQDVYNLESISYNRLRYFSKKNINDMDMDMDSVMLGLYFYVGGYRLWKEINEPYARWALSGAGSI